MFRLSLLTLVLVACSSQPPAPAPTKPAGSAAPADAGVHVDSVPAPRNLVCERLAIENPKPPPCVPEVSGGDAVNTHRARITIDGQTVVCTVNNGQPAAVCTPMFMAVQKPEQAPSAAQKTPAKK
jgi:hypothetical protein